MQRWHLHMPVVWLSNLETDFVPPPADTARVQATPSVSNLLRPHGI